jgi:AI-2 transport protein TqsA
MPPASSARSTASSILLPAAAAVIVLAGMRAAAPILVPIMLALFITVINLPVMNGLRRVGVPTPLAVLTVVLVTFGLLGLLGWVGVVSIGEIRLALPYYVQRLQEIEQAVIGWLQGRGVPIPPTFYQFLAGPDRLIELLGNVLVRTAGVMSVGFIVVLFTVFMLLESAGFPRKLRTAIGRADADLSRLDEAVRDIRRYLAIKTAISLVTGILVGFSLWLIGVDFPLLWGTLAFLMNYIPSVGSIIAAVPAVLLALIQLGPGGALLAALAFLAVNFLLGNLLEPQVMGRGFGLSTLVVVVSLVFWGWLLGPVGMLLSVPLTVVLRIALEYTPDLRWLAVLLGTQPPEEPAPPLARVRAPEPQI